MNSLAELSKERSVLVYRLRSDGDKEPILAGGKVTAGELLQVAVSDVSGEFVFHVVNGAFSRGGCEGKRSSVGGELKVSSEAKELELTVGWAHGHGTVYISEPFRLVVSGVVQPELHKGLSPSNRFLDV